MRLLSRIKRIEAAMPKPPGPCPGCGAIDPVTLCGWVRDGIPILSWGAEHRRTLIFCEHCWQTFRGVVGRQEGRAFWVTEVEFNPPSFAAPRVED